MSLLIGILHRSLWPCSLPLVDFSFTTGALW